nr:Os05g0574200 [Ipomoea trifida]
MINTTTPSIEDTNVPRQNLVIIKNPGTIIFLNHSFVLLNPPFGWNRAFLNFQHASILVDLRDIKISLWFKSSLWSLKPIDSMQDLRKIVPASKAQTGSFGTRSCLLTTRRARRFLSWEKAFLKLSFPTLGLANMIAVTRTLSVLLSGLAARSTAFSVASDAPRLCPVTVMLTSSFLYTSSSLETSSRTYELK